MKCQSNPTSAFRAGRITPGLGKWVVRIGAILAFCAGLAQAGPYDTWGKYKTLTINTTNTGGGANVSGTVTSFPVLVRLSNATAEDILNEALANGADLRFSSSDGSTALSYQIERWSSSGAWIWVLVPSITGNSTTDIRVYWKKSGQSDASSASTVFATSNSFATVWHLNESPGAGANGFADATGSGNTGTAQAGAATDTVTAVAGKGFVLNGSSKYVSSATSITNNPNTITVSAWFKTTTGSGGKILGLGTSQTGSSSGYDRHLYMGNDGKINWGINKNNSGTLVAVTSASAYNDGYWHYATGRLSASGMFLYVDGTQVGTDATVTSAQTNASAYWRAGYDNLNFWANTPSSYWLNGSLDEVIISTTARSADWIKLVYQTQRIDATCILYGSTQATTFYWNRDDVLTSSTDFSRAYNWTMNADGTGRRAPSADDDDFTTTSQDAAWTCQDSDAGAGGTCSQSTRYGRLSLAGFGADVYLTTNEFTVLRRSDITGDFDVVVRVDSIYNTHSSAKAGLFMADDFTSLGSGGYAGVSLTGASKIELQASTSSAGQLNYSSVSAATVTPPVWVRLVKSGSSVSGYYRTSLSGAWTQQGTTQTVIGTNANSQIGLLLCSHNAGLGSVAVFDEFQAGMPISSSTLDLSFAGTGSNADAAAAMTANLAAASIDFTGYTGDFGFSSSTLSIGSGNATFDNGMSITAGTGTLAFTAASGTQILTPPSGLTLPAVSNTGASTLQLSTNNLICVSYSQSAGTLDFNGKDAATLKNFTLTNGTTTSFANLTGRAITVGGNASFTGQSGNLVNMNGGAWTITVTGALTADYANIGGSNASGGSQGTATRSFNGRNNSNWLFSVPATLSNLTRSMRLNFNTTNSGGGANVSGNVANFPLFIRFTSSNLTFSATSETGADLIFVDKDGTTLNHQVVDWDKANQTGKAWVKVPQVDGNSTTDYITLYYGCDSCTSNSNARSDLVFGVFKSVYHLNSPEAAAYDATTLANNGTYVSNLPNLANGGIVTKNAAVFDGTTNSYIQIPNESNYDLSTNISVWAWIKVGSFSSAYQAIVTKADNTFRLSRNNVSNGVYFACSKTTVFAAAGSVNVNDGNWHLVVGTYDGSNVKVYVDGAQDGSSTALSGSIDANDLNIHIGDNVAQAGRVFNGSISEVRIGNTPTALSADFIKLSYETQKAGSTFLTPYTTASFQSTKVFKLNTTPSGADVSGDVTNFPLLLRITGTTILDGVQGTGTDAPADIRFLDGDGVTWLDYQVERWDRSLDSAEVWVRVPTVEGNYAGHTITMYYKQASGVTVVDGQCASCVFQTSNNFVGNWHFNTSGTGARPDAVGSAGSLTTNNYSGSELKGGVIAGADSLNGSNQYLSIASGLSDWSGGFTYTGWAYWSSTGSYARLFDFGNGSTANNVYAGRQGTSTSMVTEIYGGTTSGGQRTAASAIATGTWGHFAVTITGTTIKMYKDGSLIGTETSTQSIQTITRTNNYLGRSNWGADAYFQGKFDEVAIANTPRDANWIKLSYQNQRRDAAPLFNPSPADFVSTQKYTFNTTKTGANVSGDVTDFPLLVRISGSTITDAVEGSGVTIPPDIRFLDGDGKTWLNYVVERWTRTTDSAEVWVQIPQVDGNSDHDFITLYYNSVTASAVPDGQCASCIFGSANGFTGAWHMNDSTTNQNVAEVASQTGTFRNDVTNENTSANSHTSAGIIGRSLDFQGGAGGTGGLTQKNNFTHTLQWPKTTGTISHWIKPDQVRDMMTIYESNGTTSTTYNGLGLSGSTILECHLGIESSKYGLMYQDGSDANTLRISGGTPVAGTWAHVAATWNRSGNALVYVNGVQVASGDMTAASLSSITSTVMQVGRPGDATDLRHWDGTIDEIQVSNVERSADWMKLSYETQRRTSNLFWNTRVGPNNTAALTATATSAGNIALSWTSAVSDSTNADSVGIWVGYSAYPDSAYIAGATLVTKLPKTDSAYSYPATYPTTYYFALAVRNTSGKWSPFTFASSDTATLSGVTRPDTIYVDSSRGVPGNSCAAAQNPATPKQTITDALTCGGSATDTLVIRVMPGIYPDDNSFSVTSSKPSVVTSFDNNSRAVLAGNGSVLENSLTWIYAVALNSNMILRNMDVRANTTSNANNGIYVRANADYVDIIGNRIYGTASFAFDTSITVPANNNEGILIANNLLHKPNKFGVRLGTDDNCNVMHNVFIGPGSGSTKGLYLSATAWDAGWFNFTNNIFYNWSVGIETADVDNEVGNVSNNQFFLVTSGSEVVKETDAARIIKDPLFTNTTVGDPNAFKPLPGSPAIDAGTATRLNTGLYAYNRFASLDQFGTSRTLGTAPDIGLYEGSGHTPNPSAEFDTLQVSSTATTVTVQNSKWKLVWDKARGAGITGFYDVVSAPASNLVHTNSLLFDAKVGSYTASSQTGAGPLLYLSEGTRARAVVRQNLPVSASIDLNIYYTVYPSGHVYVESELSNLSAGSTAVTTVDYTLRMGSTSSAFTSADSTRGFGYLTTATRDAMLSVTRNLDGGASGSERWAVSTAASGTPGTVVFNTTDLADLSQNTARRHGFLLYLGETALDFAKSAALNTDAYAPSALSMSAGSLLLERSWQDNLQGHWTLDDGAGATARDKSVFVQNNATVAGANAKWVSGKVNGGLYLTATDSAYAASASILNAANGFAVMFWLKPDFTGMGDTAMIVSKGLSNANGWYFRKVANASGTNKVLFNMGGTTVTSTSLTDLAWSHIAVVSKPGGNRNLEMYVNGVQVAASTAAATATTNSLNLLMGYASGSVAAAKFKGTLDDVRIIGRWVDGWDIQSIYNRGFSSRYGHYALRADNNNRLVALINGDTAKTRLQPAFHVSNWFGPRSPNYVYLNGTRLTPNVDFVSDTLAGSGLSGGSFLVMQLNKVLTGADQTLFIDDDDSSGYLGATSEMKSLTISSTAGDKITVKNFSDTVFGGAASGQWYMEIDLNGWATPTRTTLTDTGFGEINAWKAAAVSPNVAISSAYQMVGWSYKSGRSLSYMKMDTTGSNEVFTAGVGTTTAGITYSLTDSSSTRLSLTLSGINLSQGGTIASVTKRFTFYPTGRVFVSYAVTGATIDLDAPRVDMIPRYDGANPSPAWSNTIARDSARQAFIGGSANFHSIGMALLNVKNNASNYVTGATMLGSSNTIPQFGASNDQYIAQLNMATSIWTSANKPVTVNFMMDFSKDFADAATADSLLRDAQRPAVLTAIAGARVTSDALDFNADNFAEGDGAYTFQASSGVAHFRFVNPVASFYPAFRISSWTHGVLPEFVIVDNQVLVRGYHYNAYLNTATNEVILQLNKILAAGTHVIFISHKSGLAVTLRAFTATGGEGVDTLAWTTESEFENLGFNVWRRPVPGETQTDGSLAEPGERAHAKSAQSRAAAGDSGMAGLAAPSEDTLPSQSLTSEELAALGYVRINAKLIPGAKGGSSASTLDYQYIDRTAAFGIAYEYLLEAVDFNDVKVQYGPRIARPMNPLTTELQSNYPNPFNPITTLRFSLKDKLKVSLVIYDSKGRLVRTLIRGDKPMLPGKYRLIWDAKNEGGFEAPSGQYFYRFVAGRYVKTRKMILVK